MSDTLTGREVSGTPIETRGLTSNLAGQFADPGRLGSQALSGFLGFNPADMGLGDAFTQLLANTSPDLARFDEANRPFQERAFNLAQRSALEGAGSLGGRFGQSAAEAAGRATGELQSQFNRDRFNFFNQQNAMQGQLLAQMFNALPGLQSGALSPFNLAAGFAQPGAPGFQQGILGDLLGAAGTAAGFAFGGPPGAAAAGSLMGGGMPSVPSLVSNPGGNFFNFGNNPGVSFGI